MSQSLTPLRTHIQHPASTLLGGCIVTTVLFFAAFVTATQSVAPDWASMNGAVLEMLKAEGIQEKTYAGLAQGKIVTDRRPVPVGKTGVHVAAFGIVRAPVERLWNAIEDCGRTHEFMPHMESCVTVQPDRPLAPNERWDALELSFRILFFTRTARIINQATIEAPHYLGWKQVKGDAKTNEGYYRIISITPDVQLLVYDTSTDPRIPVPNFIKAWLIKHGLPGVIAALRLRVENRSGQ
jgi:hypothetical protein